MRRRDATTWTAFRGLTGAIAHPELVDDAVGRDDGPAMDEEQREEREGTSPRDGQRQAWADVHLDGPKDPEVHVDW